MNKKDRINILKNANSFELNNYFKKMEKLSQQKGGKYTKIYNQDSEYILSNKNKFSNMFFQKGGIFGTGAKLKNEYYQNTYCALNTQNENNCYARANELDNIKRILEIDATGATTVLTTGEWEGAISKFIDFIVCCNQLYGQDIYENLRKTYLLPITQIIINDVKFSNLAADNLTKILSNERYKYIHDYIDIKNKLKELKKMNKVFTPEYVFYETKQKEYIKSYGFGLIYLTELIYSIYNKDVDNESIIQ